MNTVDKQIRIGEVADLQAIQEIFEVTIRTVCKRDYNEQQIDAWAAGARFSDRWLHKLTNQYFIVCENAGQLLGFASLDHGNYLDFMYVHKDHQGKGIASALYQAIENEAALQGSDSIVSDVSATAKPFFEKMGFETLKEQIVVIGGVPINNFRMSKQLKHV